MATENVATRLSLVLGRLLQQIGKPTEIGIRISIRREELAQMTGTTISTVSRLLSGWSEQGLVVPRRESVVVSHPENLVCEDPIAERRISPRNPGSNFGLHVSRSS
jgi:CRP-like cAMP-binding protein